MENLHKAAREVLGEKIEVSGKQRKQLYTDTDLEKQISKNKKPYLRCMATK